MKKFYVMRVNGNIDRAVLYVATADEAQARAAEDSKAYGSEIRAEPYGSRECDTAELFWKVVIL